MRRATLLWIVAVVLAFAAGLACGKLCGSGKSRGGWGMWGPEGHAKIVQRFSQKLSLTPDQTEKVSNILEERRRQMRALHYQVRPQFESMRAQTRDQIRAVLTPEQAKTYDAMEAEQDQRWQKKRDEYDKLDQEKTK